MEQLLRSVLAEHFEHDRFFGVVTGVVSNNQDPEGMHRVKVRFPWLGDDVESQWARVASPMAGSGRGVYFLPEVDDEVLVAFEHGSVDHPYVIGSLWNGCDQAPEDNSSGQNNPRAIHSRSGHVLRMDDSSGGEKIEIIGKGGRSKIVIDASANTITIEASSDISVRSSSGKLTLEGNGIELTSQAGVTIRATQSMSLEANSTLTIRGTTVQIN